MDNIVNLSLLDAGNKLKISLSKILKHLSEDNKPVLASVHPNVNDWALHKISKNSSVGFKEFISIKDVNGKDKTEVYKNEVICDVELIKDINFLKLTGACVNAIARHGHCEINTSDTIFWLDSDGEINEVNCVEKRKSFLKLGKYENVIKYSPQYMINNFVKIYGEVNFVFTDKAVNVWLSDNSTLNKLTNIKVGVDSIYVFESDVQKFMVDEIDLIPSTSSYYVDKSIRNQSDLDKLAVKGFCLFERQNKSDITTIELESWMEKEQGYPVKKAKTAAFCLRPKTRANNDASKENSQICKFKFLTEALSKFWQGEFPEPNDKKKLDPERDHKLISQVNAVICDVFKFLVSKHFSEENANYAEQILRPNVYKSMKSAETLREI